jgi:hypothetical protein
MVNIGSLDRTVRYLLGAVLVAAAFVPPLSGWVAPLGAWKYALTVWGAVMLATAALRLCPAYTLLGISSCPMERR